MRCNWWNVSWCKAGLNEGKVTDAFGHPDLFSRKAQHVKETYLPLTRMPCSRSNFGV